MVSQTLGLNSTAEVVKYALDRRLNVDCIASCGSNVPSSFPACACGLFGPDSRISSLPSGRRCDKNAGVRFQEHHAPHGRLANLRGTTQDMRILHSRVRARVTVFIVISFLASPIAPLVRAQAPAAKPASAKPTAAKPSAAAPAPATADEGWPRAYSTASGAALVVYQPQVASWADQKHAVLYAAVSYTAKGANNPALGTVKVESDTSVALDERLVSFSEFKITESNFPTLPRDQLADRCRRDRCVGAARRARDRARPRRSPTSTRARSSRRTSRA